MKQSKVSVVIPARESHDTIKTTLKSIFAQTLKPYEVIVVASKNDSTKEAAKYYISKKIIRYYEIETSREYIRDAHYKRWIGAKLARGNCIFFTDSKAYLDKDALRISTQLAQKYRVHAVAGTAVSWKKDSNLFISKLQDKALIKNNPRFNSESILNFFNFGKIESLPVTTALLVTKTAFNTIKYDFGLEFSKIASSYDDYVISWLLVKECYEILTTNKVISYHRHRTSWPQYFKQISRSGQSAAIMFRHYPECPFSTRRNNQVHIFAFFNILILSFTTYLIAVYGVFGLLFVLLLGSILMLVWGIINFLIEKDICTFFMPPITYLVIAIFSFHYLKWRYFTSKYSTNESMQYFQLH